MTDKHPVTPAVRRELPNRARGYRQNAIIGGHRVIIRTAEYEDGTLGEISIEMPKTGVAFRAILDGLMREISNGLQLGARLEDYIDMYLCMRFDPSGIVKGHEKIGYCTSILDYVVRDLGIHYLKLDELASPVADIPEEERASSEILPFPRKST